MTYTNAATPFAATPSMRSVRVPSNSRTFRRYAAFMSGFAVALSWSAVLLQNAAGELGRAENARDEARRGEHALHREISHERRARIMAEDHEDEILKLEDRIVARLGGDVAPETTPPDVGISVKAPRPVRGAKGVNTGE